MKNLIKRNDLLQERCLILEKNLSENQIIIERLQKENKELMDKVKVENSLSTTSNNQISKKVELKFEDFYNRKYISKGSFGLVHQAQNKATMEKLYAIKTMNIQTGKLPEEINKEIKLWEDLEKSRKPSSIPNFYGYYVEDIGFSGISYHLVFDYFPISLRNIIEDLKNQKEKQVFPIKKLLNFFKNLINSLAFLQSFKICHRDLKPDNLLLDEQSQNIYLIDFSESKEIITYASDNTKNELTLVGSPKYFSPELYNAFKNNTNLKINPFKSDVFSFGLIFLELGILKLPQRDNNLDVFATNIKDSIEIFKKSYDNIQHEPIDDKEFKYFVEILGKSLQINPDERPDFIDLFFENKKQNCPEDLRRYILNNPDSK